MDFEITCVPIISYLDFCILSVAAGGHQKFFYLEDAGMGLVSHEVQYVYGICMEEIGQGDIIDPSDVNFYDYDISGETDDGKHYLFFKFVD